MDSLTKKKWITKKLYKYLIDFFAIKEYTTARCVNNSAVYPVNFILYTEFKFQKWLKSGTNIIVKQTFTFYYFDGLRMLHSFPSPRTTLVFIRWHFIYRYSVFIVFILYYIHWKTSIVTTKVMYKILLLSYQREAFSYSTPPDRQMELETQFSYI